jgi:hypothetical protein
MFPYHVFGGLILHLLYHVVAPRIDLSLYYGHQFCADRLFVVLVFGVLAAQGYAQHDEIN